MARKDDVMIADGIGEEIGRLALVRKTYQLLGAAEVGLRLVLDEFAFSDEAAREVARDLEDGDGSWFHKPSDACAYARFEVRIEFVALHHIKWDGAVGKEHLARLRIDMCRISLEARDTRQRTYDHHRQHRRHIALTASHIALGIQTRQGHAARILHRRQQVEAAQREPLQLMLADDDLQRLVDVALSLNGIEEFLHGDVRQFDAKLLSYSVFVGMTGDEPVGGFANDAEFDAIELSACVLNFRQQRDASADILCRAVNNLALNTVLAQIGEDLHRCRQRVALA